MSTLPSVFNQEGSERDDGANQPAESPMDYEGRLGLYAPWDWSDQPFVECNEHQKGIFKTLVSNASRADIASRYLEVSQTWEARWFDRGYQHLEPRSGGGFSLPGANTVWGPMAVADASGVYPMNVYGRDKDIIVGALVREIPKVRFFPNDISSAEDISTAEAANRYKMLYERNARLRHVMMLMGQYYYTDDRICLYTRHVLNAPEYGLGADGTPAGSEETEVFGKLEHKVPMQ